MENRLDLAAYRLVADTERFRRGFQRSSCDDVNNEACLCRGQIEPIPKKFLRVLAAHEGDPFDGRGGKMPSLKAVTQSIGHFVELLSATASWQRHLYRRRICRSLNLAPPQLGSPYCAVGVGNYILRLRCDRCDLFLLAEILQMNPKPTSMYAFSRPCCKTDARC